MSVKQILLLFLFLFTSVKSFTTSTLSICRHSHQYRLQQSIFSLHLFWFGSNNDSKDEGSNFSDKAHQLSGRQGGAYGMGATANMMDNFKQSQELGKKTSALLQELSSLTVEGTACQGKVRVFVDGTQRPTSVEIDPDYVANLQGDDLNESLTNAMQDAHTKSIQLMEEKMNALYADLGLPSSR